ncbi:hypothetical protein [Alteromonas gilva]|uniref:Uncharacterized protein n=1 Tax=Alteromonas gilva TaxID=2987522 RepID=A0ABT5L0L9_9ALTE|nr:hypothetical protein [Alteromonas gilva]MDC8830584.1 hypothetical protein [Alteromonas gilva]
MVSSLIMEIRQALIAPLIERNNNSPKPASRTSDGATPAPGKVDAKPAAQPLTGDAGSHAKADAFRRSSGYDKPQGPAILALEAYGSHEREIKRAAIREMMGVDIYA